MKGNLAVEPTNKKRKRVAEQDSSGQVELLEQTITSLKEEIEGLKKTIAEMQAKKEGKFGTPNNPRTR